MQSNTLAKQVSEPEVKILDDLVVNQIAAGEVVERPVSVVKELVENSIDAGATAITVAIHNGGQSCIEVVDDGCGMSRENAFLAIQRFGTSKINKTEDLLNIATHGFRGEAIPSIASVSKFKLSTCSSFGDQNAGVQIVIEGGEIRNIIDGSFPPGTRIEVRSIFYNVPARKKFLRSENTEANLIKSLLVDFSLAYPQIKWKLFKDGQESFSYNSKLDLSKRARELKLAGLNPIECSGEQLTATGEFSIRAILCSPIEAVANAGSLRILVNRRIVRDKLLFKAIRDGYGNFLRPGKYPSGVLSLELPAEDLDINVHPQKAEVRFRRPEIIYSLILKTIQNGLKQTIFPANASLEDASVVQGLEQNEIISRKTSEDAESSQVTFEFTNNISKEELAIPQDFNFLPKDTLLRMRFVGQVFSCYLILEGNGLVAILDMHAAHERVMFYKLKSQLVGGKLHSQMLLIPEVITLPYEMISNFEHFQKPLEKLGFETDLISENSALVRAMPVLLSNTSAQKIFSELFALPVWADWKNFLEKHLDTIIARMACHGSVRRGQELKAEEVYELLDSLQNAENSGFCPHGRPVIKFLKEAELETLFGRRE